MNKETIHTLIAVVAVTSVVCCAYFYSELADSRRTASELRERNEVMEAQLEARNGVIDKELGINLNDPLSLSENFDEVKKEHRDPHGEDFDILTDQMCREIILPLYTPDGHYFGKISYAAYSAILNDALSGYTGADDAEMRILHSYLNYITLNPGMSLAKY